MRPTIAADATVRALIAAIPDNRLRELFLELALAALAVPAVEEPKPAARNGRRRGRGKGARRGKGRHKIDRRRAYLDTLNAKRREQRQLAREAGEAAGAARKKPGPMPKLKSNGTEAHGNGGAVSAAALWEHARKLEPRQPWRAVSRELGINEGAAQVALRNLAVPEDVSPAAAERFLTL